MKTPSLLKRPVSKGCLGIAFLSSLLISQLSFSQAEKPVATFPKLQGYIAIFHPIDGYNTPQNFKENYVVGFPIGITVFNNERLGYSFELFPFIQADGETSKVSKVVFHPGVVYRLKRGFSCAGRIAFESTGRYGLTQVLTKAIVKTKSGALGASLVVAERFGNDQETSVSYGIGIGISF
jgi:hypothetical protein